MRRTNFGAIHAAVMCAILSASLVLAAQDSQPPAGWTVSHQAGKQVYRPDRLAATDSFALAIDPPSSLGNRDIQNWFLERVKLDADERGPYEETEPFRRSALGIVSIERLYKRGARVWDVVYLGFPLIDGRVLFCSTASNMRDVATYVNYTHVAGRICGQTAKSIDRPATPKN